MSNKMSNYSFLNAKLKSRLSNTITPEAIDRLIKARTLPEAVLILKDTIYAPLEVSYSATGDLSSAEAELVEYELSLYTSLFKLAEEPVLSVIRTLVLRFEIEKLEYAVRLWFDSRVRNRRIDGRTGYLHRDDIVNHFDVDKIIHAKDVESLCEVLVETPYFSIAKDKLTDIFTTKSLFSFEASLENFYYESMLLAIKKLSKSDREVAKKFIGTEIDTQNIARLIRFKNFYNIDEEQAISYFIPGGLKITKSDVQIIYSKSDSLVLNKKRVIPDSKFIGATLLAKYYPVPETILNAAGTIIDRLEMLEKAMRKINLRTASKAFVGDPFSIGIVLAYFIKSREEIRQITTILNAKRYSLSEERIRNAL